MVPRAARLTALALALPAAAAAQAVGGATAVVARTRIGVVTTGELERFLATRPAGTSTDARRLRLEELVALRAAEREGAAALSNEPALRAELERRLDDVRAEAARKRLEAASDEAAAAALTAEAVGAAVAASPLGKPVEQLRLRHIFKRVPHGADAAERARIEAEMQAIRRELDGGAEFTALARARSDSQTASFDGLMAPVARGELDPALEERLWRLTPGQVTDVVRTSAGLQVFRLEGRETRPALAPEDVRRAVSTQMERDARAAFARGRMEEMARRFKVETRPQVLADLRAPAETVALAFPGGTLTVGDLFRTWSQRSFVERRTSDLADVLEEAAARRVLLESARELRLDEDPEVARRLEEARRQLAIEVAQRRRAEQLTASVGDDEIRRVLDADPARVEQTETRRLRGVLVRLAEARQANAVFDALDPVARQIRGGERDLADVARELSQDASRREGGDFGWAAAEELAAWAGSRVSAALAGARPGELVGPLLVETYDSHRLVYVPRGYLLARVEEVRPAGPTPVAASRSERLQRYRVLRASEIGRRMRADLLASVDAVLVERP